MATRFCGSGDTMALERSSPKEIVSKLKEAIIATTLGGVGGAIYGGIVGRFIVAPLARRYSRALTLPRRTQYGRLCAREFSAVCAALSGTESIMRGIRGEDDLASHLVTGSAGGLAYSFAERGLKGQRAHALSSAAASAVVFGISYKVGEAIKSRNAQNAFYTEARAMLSKLGLEECEKNFKKGRFTDPTLPLFTDRELQEVNIPPGARLLILDHIKRHPMKVNRK